MDTLSVRPDRQGDPHYRYRMPPIEAAVDNRNKQRKTHLRNAAEVASSVFRPEAWLVKYIALRLSTDSGASTSSSEAYITGHHDQHMLQSLVFDFVTDYVLCKCGSPETLLRVEGKKKRKTCQLQCHSCGRSGSARGQDDKMLNLFVSHPMPPELLPMMRGDVPNHAEALAHEADQQAAQSARDVSSRSTVGCRVSEGPAAATTCRPGPLVVLANDPAGETEYIWAEADPKSTRLRWQDRARSVAGVL